VYYVKPAKWARETALGIKLDKVPLKSQTTYTQGDSVN
jgi:hypothetical protein